MKSSPILTQSAVAILCALCLLAQATAQAGVDLVISGLDQPVRLVAPAGDPRLFVVQRNGVIRVFNQNGAEQDTLLDIRPQTTTGSERGLLGLAFPPDHTTTGRFYINFTDLQGDTHVARYQLQAGNTNRADPTSQEILLAVDQPYSNHNGGHIEFGPDGMLYVGLGDGGSGGDPQNRAQNDQLLLGKMLRLDVSGTTGYANPADNPFIGQAPRDEIWAKGLRNPWCFSFDRATGDLYIADVGQEIHEEINVQAATSPGGENYGWRLMEGAACYNPTTGCDDGSLTLPVSSYLHGGQPYRCSISGGYVYRGSRLPSLTGQYFYADYCSNQIWSLTWTSGGGATASVDRTADFTPAGGYGSIAAFGQDGLGELYILDLTRGRAYRVVSSGSGVPEVHRRPFLSQNYPNPFNPRTEIVYTVQGPESRVSLRVYDLAGRLVRHLVDKISPAGDHHTHWDGTDDAGKRVVSGIYLYQLVTDEVITSRKMILLD